MIEIAERLFEEVERGTMTRREAVGLEPRRTHDRVYFDDPDGLEVQFTARRNA